jgi:hypothetical protein
VELCKYLLPGYRGFLGSIGFLRILDVWYTFIWFDVQSVSLNKIGVRKMQGNDGKEIFKDGTACILNTGGE